MNQSGTGGWQRVEDLADSVGTTVRNVRVYQERGLLQTPVRRGRIALYGPEHARRLDLIIRLLDRGYTFATIEELLIAERHGFTLSELLRVERVHSGKRSTGSRRRSRGATDPVARFELPEELVDKGSAIGLSGEPGSSDHFLADTYMYELFRELIVLGVDQEALDRIGHKFIEGQNQAAESLEVLVETLRNSGMDRAVIERRVTGMLPRAGAAARLIFLSAAQTILTERYGFPRG